MYAYFVYSKSQGVIGMFTNKVDALAYQVEWSSYYPKDTTEIKLERRW